MKSIIIQFSNRVLVVVVVVEFERGGLRCSCVTSSAFRIVSMIKRPVLPYFEGCQTGRAERGLVLVELVREGRFIKSSFKIKGVSVFFF